MQMNARLAGRIGRAANRVPPAAGGWVPEAFRSGLYADFTLNRYWDGWEYPLATKVANTATAGLAERADGVFQEFGTNVLKRTDLGLWNSPSRTNLVAQSTPAGAVGLNAIPNGWAGAGSQNVPREVIGYGVEDGLPYVEVRWAGIAPAAGNGGLNFGVASSTPVVASETYTASLFMKVISASGLTGQGNTFNLGTNVFAGGVNSYPSVAIPFAPGSRVRGTQTRTMEANATGAIPYFIFNWSAGATVDVVVRIYAPQLELGSFATSPILTTGASATRAGDRLTSQVDSQARGFVLDIDIRSNDFAVSPRLVEWNDGTANNRYTLIISNIGNFSMLKTAAGVAGTTTSLAGTSFSGPGVYRLYGAFGPGYHRFGVIGKGESSAVTTNPEAPPITTRSFASPGYVASNSVYAAFRRYGEKIGAANDELYNVMKAVAQGWAA